MPGSTEQGLICPFCKGSGQITAPDLKIDTMSNVVFCKAGSARLTPAETLFLKAVLKAYPDPYAYERGCVLFPNSPRNLMGVLACHLSRKLKPLGYAIRAQRSIGYKLVRYLDETG